MATKILETGGDTKPLAKLWFTKCLTQHSQVKGMVGKPFDRLRVQKSTHEAIGQLFTLFEKIQREFQLAQEIMSKIDEHGLGQNICANQCVLGELTRTLPKEDLTESRVDLGH